MASAVREAEGSGGTQGESGRCAGDAGPAGVLSLDHHVRALLMDRCSRSDGTRCSFHWIQPLLYKGYLRPLEKGDLWQLDENRSASLLADALDAHYAERQRRAAEWNARLESGEINPGRLRKWWWKMASRHLAWGKEDGTAEASLAGAISDTFFWKFWSAGFLKIVSDGLTVTSPFVTRALISYGSDVWAYTKGYPGAEQPPSAGRGYGLAVGLLGMQVAASLCLHQVRRTPPIRKG